MRLAVVPLLLLSLSALAQTPPMTPDTPAKFEAAVPDADHTRKAYMVPMRDGVKLYTVVLMAKGTKDAPIMLTRTPYNAAGRSTRNHSPNLAATLPEGDLGFVRGGYIRVYQDVRGKYGSEGDYVMTRPARGPLNTTRVDHATDAWDTIDWLVKNIKEANGKVGMVGSSYEGFTVMMALLDPHPALKAAVPMSPMVDSWRGDDWFHNGAFRQPNMHFFVSQTSRRGAGGSLSTGIYDEYEDYLRTGSAGAYAKKYGIDALPFMKKMIEHPAYDAYWQEQALDRLLARKPLTVPTMYVVGRWDQEDIYGAYAAYAAMEPKDTANTLNYLVVGPWRHSGVNYEGATIGPLKLPGDTAAAFRHNTMQRFFDQHLKGGPDARTPPVLSFQTGANVWRHLDKWPSAADSGQLYLHAGGALGFERPEQAGKDDFVSDPAKPVPFVPRPVRSNDGAVWRNWLLNDQRAYADRLDVLTYVTPPLKQALHVAGQPMVNLLASTTGTDADWVVKLIDVYPDEVPDQPEMGGYQLAIGMDIFRGRYRHSLEKPVAIPAGAVEQYRFALPNVDHVFLPGHRIMVQVQSSWFPLYDRNPQTFVPNIFLAQPGDYRKATHTIHTGGDNGSMISLPLVR
jgi:putative CocE/NonD family hydrolase